MPRDAETARRFFEPGLRDAWTAPRDQPYDFLVQSERWKLGPVSIAILRKQFDKTYVAVTFDNQSRAITLNFIVVDGPDGWVISDVESPHDLANVSGAVPALISAIVGWVERRIPIGVINRQMGIASLHPSHGTQGFW